MDYSKMMKDLYNAVKDLLSSITDVWAFLNTPIVNLTIKIPTPGIFIIDDIINAISSMLDFMIFGMLRLMFDGITWLFPSFDDASWVFSIMGMITTYGLFVVLILQLLKSIIPLF